MDARRVDAGQAPQAWWARWTRGPCCHSLGPSRSWPSSISLGSSAKEAHPSGLVSPPRGAGPHGGLTAAPWIEPGGGKGEQPPLSLPGPTGEQAQRRRETAACPPTHARTLTPAASRERTGHSSCVQAPTGGITTEITPEGLLPHSQISTAARPRVWGGSPSPSTAGVCEGQVGHVPGDTECPPLRPGTEPRTERHTQDAGHGHGVMLQRQQRVPSAAGAGETGDATGRQDPFPRPAHPQTHGGAKIIPLRARPRGAGAGRVRGRLPSVSIHGDDRVQGTWPVAATASSAPHLHPSRVQTLSRHCPFRCQIKSGNSLNPVEQADFFWEMLVSMFSLLGFPGLRGGLRQASWVLFLEALLFPGEKDLRKQILSD